MMNSQKRAAIVFMVGTATLLFLLFATNPNEIGPFGITSFYLSVLAVVASFLYLVLQLFKLRSKPSIIISVSTASALTTALVIGTQNLTFLDVGLMLVFAITAIFYLMRL